MNTPNQKDLEQNVIQAARTLAAQLVQGATSARHKQLVSTKVKQLKGDLEEAEFALTEAEFNLAAARFLVQTTLRAYQKGYVDDLSPVVLELLAARKPLLTVGINGDDQAILEAASDYGNKVDAYWFQRKESDRLHSKRTNALEALKAAQAAFKLAQQRHEKARVAIEQAEAECRDAHAPMFDAPRLHVAQVALADAAILFTGMQGKAYPFQPLHPTELDITLP